MDFMGIGPFELLLVLIIGFLLLGPDKLPEMAAKAGRLYRNLKRATSDLTKTVTEDLSAEKSTLSEDLSNIRKTIIDDLSSENKADEDSVAAAVAESGEKSEAESTQKATPPPDSPQEVNER